jgi:RHS repeat-associated protein
MASNPYSYESCTSLPFGDGLNCVGSDVDPLHFTGKERDAATGLDNFGARYNSTNTGRWISPDAINLTDARVLNPANTLNKYIYGGNNPLMYTDPDGRDITVFYTQNGGGGFGHFWMVAYDQSTGDSAVMDFGPSEHDALTKTENALNIPVPGDVNYASRITSLDQMRQDYTSLTIQTNPEDAQKAIQAIKSFNSSDHDYQTYNTNCTTVCRDVLHSILNVDSGVRPYDLWQNIFTKWSNAAIHHTSGNKPLMTRSTTGNDYGQPRYGMDTFRFVWLLLHPPKFCTTILVPDGKGGSKPETVCS